MIQFTRQLSTRQIEIATMLRSSQLSSKILCTTFLSTSALKLELL